MDEFQVHERKEISQNLEATNYALLITGRSKKDKTTENRPISSLDVGDRV
jgi:hypothetical protein